jgi:hypothetical protein
MSAVIGKVLITLSAAYPGNSKKVEMAKNTISPVSLFGIIRLTGNGNLSTKQRIRFAENIRSFVVFLHIILHVVVVIETSQLHLS